MDWFAGGDGVALYLLTHMHTDHLSGLFEARGRVHSTWARRTGPRIVCSAQTKALLVARGVPGCRICELPLNQSCAVNVGGGSSGPTVTLFDANHCPGSVMFHVQWNDVNNLHTGDFRYKAEIHGSKHMIEQIKYVHKVFLDTTFCHESWDSTNRHFPSQEESIQLLIGLIKQEIACGQRDVSDGDAHSRQCRQTIQHPTTGYMQSGAGIVRSSALRACKRCHREYPSRWQSPRSGRRHA